MASTALFVRSCSALRPASTLPSLGAFCIGGLGDRGYATVEVPSEVLAAASQSVPAVAAAAVPGSAAATADIDGVLGSTIGAIDALHAATGLPWWATISAVGVLVRTAMLPVSIKGMAASGAIMPLLREARRQAAADLAASSAASAAAATGLTPQHDQQQQQQQGREGRQKAAAPATAAARAAAVAGKSAQQQQQQQQAPEPSMQQVLARVHALRQAQGAPHPMWVLASPLLQLPVFITAMASIRTMSLNSWPGFSTGGLAWFPDLTLPAMDLSTLTAPMGSIGAVLPVAITLSMFANIQSSFALPPPSPSSPQQQQQAPTTLLYVMDKLKLLLEWLLVPLFGVALQLPHGALCYWATSSAYALLQGRLLRDPEVRQLLGLGLPGRAAVHRQQRPLPPPTAEAGAAELAASSCGGAAGSRELTEEEARAAAEARAKAAEEAAALRQFLASTTDMQALFVRAAELRSEGKVRASIAVLQRLLELHPRQPRALYALGQLHTALRQWPAAEQMYLLAAEHEQDQQQRARAWFGAAVALHQQQELETALDAFQKAADAAQADDLRVRSWVAQAALYRKLGQPDQAAELLQRAAKIEPRVEELYLKPLQAGQQDEQVEQAAAQARKTD